MEAGSSNSATEKPPASHIDRSSNTKLIETDLMFVVNDLGAGSLVKKLLKRTL